MYKYSERPKTLAERKFEDDVPEAVKSRRLQEIIDKQLGHSLANNRRQIGEIHQVLVEGASKKSVNDLVGRDERNTKIVFPAQNAQKGDYVWVKINECTSATLIGEIVPQPN